MLDPAEILIIFDLDFTLIDNSFAICSSFNHALAYFQIGPLEHSEILKMIGIPLKTMFLEYLEEKDSERGVTLFREYYKMHYFENVKLLPGARNLLDQLKESRYRLALLTSKKTNLAIKLLEYINLKHYFEQIIGEQKEFKPKPDPSSITYLISKFPTVKKIYMIGDHLVDCQAAKRAGISFIGVLTGNTSEAEIRTCAGIEGSILKSVQDIIPSQHLL